MAQVASVFVFALHSPRDTILPGTGEDARAYILVSGIRMGILSGKGSAMALNSG